MPVYTNNYLQDMFILFNIGFVKLSLEYVSLS